MSSLRQRLALALVVVCMNAFAAAQSGNCPFDTSNGWNIKICAPTLSANHVAGRFVFSFSAYSTGLPIATIRLSAVPGNRVLKEYTPNAQQWADDAVVEMTLQYDQQGVLAQMWDTSGRYFESFMPVWIRKTAGTCAFPTQHLTMNMCEPGTTGTVTGPVKLVSNAWSGFVVSHVAVYVDGVERYNADDDEVYTYLNLTPGAHLLTTQYWDSQGSLIRDERSFTVVDRAANCGNPTSAGVVLCQPASGDRMAAPLRLTARTNAGSVPITYMRLYRNERPIWEGPFQSADTDVHFSVLAQGLEGPANYGLVAWNQQGASFVATASATVNGYMPPPACAIPADHSVVLCGPGTGDVVPAKAIVSARARWDGKTIAAMRVYVDYQEAQTVNLPAKSPFLYSSVSLAPGQHRLVVVAWTNTGEAMASAEQFVTVQ